MNSNIYQPEMGEEWWKEMDRLMNKLEVNDKFYHEGYKDGYKKGYKDAIIGGCIGAGIGARIMFTLIKKGVIKL